VFDPQTVADRSSYSAPREPSTGMKYVIVGGSVLIDQGKLMPGIFPGKALEGGLGRTAQAPR
jgi:N-acyl-D-aspartate/D-glutamate deacylase